jgi:hypothetical protein
MPLHVLCLYILPNNTTTVLCYKGFLYEKSDLRTALEEKVHAWLALSDFII